MDHSKMQGIFKDVGSDGIQQQVDKDGLRKKLNQYFENRKVLLQNVAEVKQQIHHEIDSLIGILKERELQLCLEVDRRCLKAEANCLDRLNLIQVGDEVHSSSSSSASYPGKDKETLMNSATPLQETGFSSQFHFINNTLAEYGRLTTREKALSTPKCRLEQTEYFSKLTAPGSPKSKQTIGRGTPESEDSFELIDPVEVPPLEALPILQTEVKGDMTKHSTTRIAAKIKRIPNFSFWKKNRPKTEERPLKFFDQAEVDANVQTPDPIPTTVKSDPFFKVDMEALVLYNIKLLFGYLEYINRAYPKEVVNNMRNLIQDVIDGTVQPDEILTKEMGCDASSFLTILHAIYTILKIYLPYIRHELVTKELILDGIRPPPTGVFTLPVSLKLQQKQDEEDGIEVISKDETDEDSTSIDSFSTTTSKTLPCRETENRKVKPSHGLTTTVKCLQFLSTRTPLPDELSECPDLMPKEEGKLSPSALLVSSFEEYLAKDDRESWLSPRSSNDKSEWLPCKDSANVAAHLKDGPKKWLSARGSLDKWLSSEAKSEKTASINDGVKNYPNSCIRKAESLNHPRPIRFDAWIASNDNSCIRKAEGPVPPQPIKFDEWIASRDNSGNPHPKEIPVSNLFSNFNSSSQES